MLQPQLIDWGETGIMKKILFASACAIAFAATPALAQDWSGSLSGGYEYFATGGASLNSVGTQGLASVPLNWNDLNLQADGDYHHLWGGGASVDAGTLGGALVWNGSDVRTALNAQYHMTPAGNATTYGAGVEWYAAPDWTVGLRGGGLSLAGGGGSGGYFGGEVVKYLVPDFALSAGIDYTSLSGGHATDYSARAEYLVWNNLSIYGGYTFTDVPGAGLHSLMIGLKLYCDGDGPALVDHQRSGPATYISTYSPVFLTF
jgi:hypothetical protein